MMIWLFCFWILLNFFDSHGSDYTMEKVENFKEFSDPLTISNPLHRIKSKDTWLFIGMPDFQKIIFRRNTTNGANWIFISSKNKPFVFGYEYRLELHSSNENKSVYVMKHSQRKRKKHNFKVTHREFSVLSCPFLVHSYFKHMVSMWYDSCFRPVLYSVHCK